MTRERLRAEVLDFMSAHEDGSRDESALDALLGEVAAFQASAIPAYASLARRAGGALPAAVPTDVFRFIRLAVHAEEDDIRVFRTSGTTKRERGAHPFRDLSVYERAAILQARRFLFPDERTLRFVLLAPSSAESPDSSLSYMLDLLAARFGVTSRHYLSGGGVLADAVEADLLEAETKGVPLAILGTSFALVHLEDALGARSFSLPEGSRIMQTGGFKGRSRELTASEMRTRLASRYGVAEERVVSEYGMTELSSQFYEPNLRASLLGEPAPARRYVPAPWVRAVPVDPESLAPVPDGELGLLRIDDLANLDSIACVQTSDLARRVDGTIELVGRAPGSTPRGCSLAIDEMLGSTK
jgi:hypothetical protein